MAELKARIKDALRDGVEMTDGDSLPVARLATLLVRKQHSPEELDALVLLLGDGLTGGLLYRTAPEHVLARLDQVRADLADGQRFRIFASMLELRPIRPEDHVRYVRLALDLLGVRAGDPVSFDNEQKYVVYRWSNVLLKLTALQAPEVVSLFRERGIDNEGTNAFEIFRAWLDYRATVLITPRQSPAARRELESMQRLDWLDMPWMLGTRGTTFTVDEIEEDSSPENMADGGRITDFLSRQRRPDTDFFVHAYAWHPRQELEAIRAATLERGTLVLAPAPYDLDPFVVEPADLSHDARQVQAVAVRALADLADTDLPVELSLTFHEGEQVQEPVLEFKVATTFAHDGKKLLVRLIPADVAAAIGWFRDHASLLTPAGLPLALARLFTHCSRIHVHVPDGPAFQVSEPLIAAWDSDASRQRPVNVVSQAASVPTTILGVWRGHLTPDLYDHPQSVRLVLSQEKEGLSGLLTVDDASEIELVGSVNNGRLALRQQDSGPFIIECAWDEQAGHCVGRWRQWESGGPLELTLEASTPELPSAAELMARVTEPWASRVRLDLDKVRFPGELAMLRALFDDENFRTAYVDAQAMRAVGTEAMQLDTLVGRGATELNRAMLPSVFEALDVAVAALGLTHTVRMWAHNDSSINAFVTLDGEMITVHLTSGLIEVLEGNELVAVIGHELAHVVLGTHELAVRVGHTQMSGAARLRYFALRRCQELSADRLALVACGDLKAAVVTQTMLRTGIRRRELLGSVESIVDNARSEVERLRKRSDPGALIASHPYDSLRTVVLERFARSTVFAELSGRDGEGEVDENELAAELEEFTHFLQPSQIDDDGKAEADVLPRWKALAALEIALADKSVTTREVRTLIGLDPSMTAELDRVLRWTHERRAIEIHDLSREVVKAQSVAEREALLHRLLEVVRADNVVQYAETGVVERLGALLALDTHSFRKTMDDLYRGAR